LFPSFRKASGQEELDAACHKLLVMTRLGSLQAKDSSGFGKFGHPIQFDTPLLLW
jgi:hypothetical protein